MMRRAKGSLRRQRAAFDLADAGRADHQDMVDN
jgi:hypothetical protein